MRGFCKHVITPVACLAVALVWAGAGLGATIHVGPGQSIQHAVNQAHPGDTIVVAPGVYHENVTIAKNHLTLLGTPWHTFLEPGSSPTPSRCSDPTDPSSTNGICAAGLDPSGNPRAPVTGTTIRGFVVRGFGGFGVSLFNAADSTVARVVSAHNGSYGISGFGLTGVRYLRNVAHDNGEPGFYVGDSPNAHALVENNVSYRNGVGGPEGIGMLFRDSRIGVVRYNRVWGNCAGMVFADTGEDPVPASLWRARWNAVYRNNGSCTGEPGGAPPFSGTGIALLGARHMVVRENGVFDNRPSGPSAFPGGIVVVDSTAIGGRTPVGDYVIHNWAYGNRPFDVSYDGSGTGNVFTDNRCGVSHPSSICAH